MKITRFSASAYVLIGCILIGCVIAAAMRGLTGASAQISANVTVNVKEQLAVMPREGIGVNAAVYENSLANPDGSPAIAAALARNAGINVFRFPGGSYADVYDWQNNAAMPGFKIYTGPKPEQNTFINFMNRLVLPAHATAMITCNYGSDTHGTNAQLDFGGDPNYAAGWVRYANLIHHFNIQYWGIGNEVSGSAPKGFDYSGTNSTFSYGTNSAGTNYVGIKDSFAGFYGAHAWELNMHKDITPMAYGRDVVRFAKAMKAVDPNIKIGVEISQPRLYPDTDARFPYNQCVLTNCAEAVDYVIIHYYPAGEGVELLSRSAEIPEIVRNTRRELNEYLGSKRAAKVQIAIAETGAGANTGVVVSLWAADNYLSWLENGVFNVDYKEFHKDMLLEYPKAPLTNQQPAHAYYGAQMAHLLAEPGDTMLQTTSDHHEIRAHASLRKDGRIGVMLLNANSRKAERVTVKIEGVKLGTEGISYNFGPAQFRKNDDVPVGCVTTNLISEVGNTFSIMVPAFTMADVLIPVLGD